MDDKSDVLSFIQALPERWVSVAEIRSVSRTARRYTDADEETIRTVHYLLADSLVALGAAGQIRDESILVSGTTYAPLEGHDRLRSNVPALRCQRAGDRIR